MSTFYIDLEKEYLTRFSAGKFMEFTDNSDPLNSYFLEKLITLPKAGSYYVRENPGRPEVLAWKIWEDTQYWWELLLYNRIVFPWYIPAGFILNYPSLSALESLYFSLKAEETKSQ